MLLIFPKREGWHYIAKKSICIIWRKNFKTAIFLSENKDFCNVIMSFIDTKMLEFNQYHIINLIKDDLFFMQVLNL